MDKARKRSATRVKSPAGQKSTTGKSPARSRSKTGAQPAKKEAKARARSKSRTKKEPRSRSRARGKSKSPARRTRSRSRRSTSRTRASSRGKKVEYSPVRLVTGSNSIRSGSASAEVDAFLHRKMNLVVKDVYHDDYVKDSFYKDIIRRSMSKESSQDKNSTVGRRYSSLAREASEPKDHDGMVKDAPLTNMKMSNILEKKRAFNIGIPKGLVSFSKLLFVPAFILLLHLACTKEQCTLSKFHIHRNLNLYFNPQSAMIVSGFVVVQAMLSLLSIGRRVGGPPSINGTLMYRCNGLLSTFLSAGIVAALWHYNYPVTIVYERMMSMIVASTVIAYVFGLILFIKGGRASIPSMNPESIGASRIHQFAIGREINPFLFGKLNVKTLLLRVSLNGLVIMNGLLLLRAYLIKHELNYTLLTCVALITILVADFFWFEDSFPSTFEAMYEGTGCYLTLCYMLYPFFPTLITKYIIHHKVEVPVYGLAAIITFFVIGYVIYRASNLQKSAFRKNPLNPALAHFETIPTSRGKKLLASSWWGFVRHPNYLGSIILHWAWASTAGYAHAIPYIFPLTITLVLLNRARRVDDYCRDRYQSAWDKYSSLVPNRIIPRVF